MTKRKWCAREGCKEPVGPPSGRFCHEHRREHGAELLAQLAAIDAPRPRPRAGRRE